MNPAAPKSAPPGAAFWKIAGAGAAFQAGAAAVDSATIVASLVHHLTGSVFAVGAASTVLRLGWLLPQLIIGFLAQRADRRMPYYIVGAFGRAACLAVIAVLLAFAGEPAQAWMGAAFLVCWTIYAFVSGIVAVPYNDIVGRSIPSHARSRLLAWRFFAGGLLALGVAAIIHRLLASAPLYTAYALTFALASVLMVVSSFSFVSAGEPAAPASSAEPSSGFGAFIGQGLQVLADDRRFRLFLITQWLGGATLMAMPFYIVAGTRLGLGIEHVALLLGAQTVGSLSSNALWGRIGDHHGKLRLLQTVGLLRPIPAAAMFFLLVTGVHQPIAFALLFFLLGALVNGTTIGYLGYLMEISPDDRRPAYSAYFNALASPAALLPLVGAGIVAAFSLETLFAIAVLAAVVQFGLLRRLGASETA
ncbi:MAG: MFS transporter [Alphaproteobacteria bacterium]